MGEFGDDVLGCPDIDALVERVVDEVGIEVLEMRVRDEHRTHAVEGRRWSKSAGIDQDAGRFVVDEHAGVMVFRHGGGGHPRCIPSVAATQRSINRSYGCAVVSRRQ